VAAIATIVAPVLGPTLGGYITDQASWRWIFFLNIPVGVLAVFLVSILVEDPPWEKNKRSRGVDYIGLSLITLGLGALQIMMDRGEDVGWFESGFIWVTALIAFTYWNTRRALDAQTDQIIEAEIERKLPDDFEAQVKQATLQFYASELRPISHVGEAIAAIGLPKCVASSGTPEKIRHGLVCAGIYDQLAPHIFSASQVKRGKPAPDLFLFAAERMRTAPARCLVIEDSIPGVTGAVAAGMTVLGFHGGSHCRPGYDDTLRAAGATMTFDDMRQLPGLIARIGAPAILG